VNVLALFCINDRVVLPEGSREKKNGRRNKSTSELGSGKVLYNLFWASSLDPFNFPQNWVLRARREKRSRRHERVCPNPSVQGGWGAAPSNFIESRNTGPSTLNLRGKKNDQKVSFCPPCARARKRKPPYYFQGLRK